MSTLIAERHPESVVASHQGPLHVDRVTLAARDIDALATFYEDVIGLDRIEEGERDVLLGAGATGFLRLVASPDARPEPANAAGLFHIAFLLPDRASLGAWFAGASARGARFTGASDHGVSEAFYLDDPEGNGIEVYADRPRAVWPRRAEGYALTTAPMDVEGVIAEGQTKASDGRVPPATRIGHVHLKVGDIARAEAFWSGAIGLDIMDRRPGGTFYASGGYHHHVATNVWRSRGAGPRPDRLTGLREIAFSVFDAGLLDAIAARLGKPVQHGAVEAADPWSISIRLEAGAGAAPIRRS